MSEPRIYTKNYVNGDNLFSVTSGSGSIVNIYDRDNASQWISSGAALDATTVQIDVTFYEGVTAINRAIDTLILLNHNIKNFVLYYWDGTTYQTWLTKTSETTTNTVYSLSTQTISKIRFEMTLTQTTNVEKAIGELILCTLQLDLGVDLDEYDVSFRQKVKPLLLGDGSFQQMLVYWSPNRTEKYEAKIKMRLVPTALLASLQAIKETGNPFLWYPESSQRPSEIWLVHWANPWRYRYSDKYKNVGYDLEFDLKEI